jgi:hypothetical protein
MTRDELKAILTPTVIDSTLSKEERDRVLVPTAKLWMIACESTDMTYEQVMNEWNLVMVEIVDEYGLRRH